MCAVFKIACLDCEYETQEYDYPDIAAHAWNLTKVLEIAKLLESVNLKNRTPE